MHGRMLLMNLEIARLCAQAHSIVAITGAGISTGSGLPTITSKFGGRTLKEVFRGNSARRHINEYQKFYDNMTRSWREASPNAAHQALAEHQVRVITQNIDGLHQNAGSRHVIELHGTLRIQRCANCAHTRQTSPNLESQCPVCGGMMWPDIVLEGDRVRSLALACNWLTVADLLLIIGTKLEMYPVNQFPLLALRNKTPVVVINEDAQKLVPLYFSMRTKSGPNSTLELPARLFT